MSKDEQVPQPSEDIAQKPVAGSAWGPRPAMEVRQKFTPNVTRPLGLSVCQSFSQAQESTGRFWGVYGRKYLPFAKRVHATRYVSDVVYRWWLSKVDSPYCKLDRGWTVYTPRGASLYASLNTALKRDGDEGWRESHWRANAKLAIIQHLGQSDEPTPAQLRFALIRQNMIERHGILFDAP